jgi:hypothetical protein
METPKTFITEEYITDYLSDKSRRSINSKSLVGFNGETTNVDSLLERIFGKVKLTKELVSEIESIKSTVPVVSLLGIIKRLPPDVGQINETISLLERRIEDKRINRSVNAGVKEGYELSIDILANDVEDIDREINCLKTIQGRAIAYLAIDYLKGDCNQNILCDVPIRN